MAIRKPPGAAQLSYRNRGNSGALSDHVVPDCLAQRRPGATWSPIIGWIFNEESWSLPQDNGERERILRIVGIYFVSIAGPALLLSLFALRYGPIGLVRNPGGRIVYGGQLLVALLSLASSTAGAFAVSVAMFNPG